MRPDDNEVDRTRTAVPQDSADGLPRPDMVTSVIQHRVHVSAQAQYETWLQKITPAAQHFPGHQGVNIIRAAAGADVYTIVLHFDTLEPPPKLARLGNSTAPHRRDRAPACL